MNVFNTLSLIRGRFFDGSGSGRVAIVAHSGVAAWPGLPKADLDLRFVRDRVIACAINTLLLLAVFSQTACSSVADPVQVIVTPRSDRPISPFIYGISRFSAADTIDPVFTVRRAGGNRWTAYNWQNNASNAGSDYQFQNDAFLGGGSVPAEAARSLIEADQRDQAASIITFPLQGWVAADLAGPVSMGTNIDVGRFRRLVFEKKSASPQPFTDDPTLFDRNVYSDEYAWVLNKRFEGDGIFSAKPKRAPVFITLDNEPELWSKTHREIQGGLDMKAADYIARSLSLARVLKAEFPEITLLAPGNYGFFGLYSWQKEIAATPSGNDWFIDRFLRAAAQASVQAGHSLVDVYDLHWYSENTDSKGERVVGLTQATLTDDQMDAVINAPRSLGDRTYVEHSWIAKLLGGPVNLLDRLQSKIRALYPSMRLSISEYNNGGGRNIAGLLAEAQMLGYFASEQVFCAVWWPLSRNEPYTEAAFQLFRNFDGQGGRFGDRSYAADIAGDSSVAAFASGDSKAPGRSVVILINRGRVERKVQIEGLKPGLTRAFTISRDTTVSQQIIQPAPGSPATWQGNKLLTSLAPLSATAIEIQAH